MGVLVKYKNGAVLTYSLIAYAPYEGYRIAFNGSKGRMELNSIETPVFNEDGVMDSKSVVIHFAYIQCLEKHMTFPLPLQKADMVAEIRYYKMIYLVHLWRIDSIVLQTMWMVQCLF